MAVYEITHPPIQGARAAIWTRLSTDGNTSGYNLLREGQEVDFPYIAVGPGYQGAGGSDPSFGVNAVIQLETYALARAGGSQKATDMMEDVFEAISASAITYSGLQTLPPIIEEYVINPNLFDDLTKEFYTQVIARLRFMVTD